MKSHPLKKCLLNAYYVLGARDTVVSHRDTVCTFVEFTFQLGVGMGEEAGRRSI